MNIVYHTNIDCAKRLTFPQNLPERPQVGDKIRSLESTNTKHIELEVVDCTWVEYTEGYDFGTYLLVELHLPKHRFVNIADFEQFLKRVD